MNLLFVEALILLGVDSVWKLCESDRVYKYRTASGAAVSELELIYDFNVAVRAIVR